MMHANAHTSKKFTRMCFEKSEVTSAEKKKLKVAADYTDDACLGEIDLEYNKYIAEGRLIRICP